MAKKKKFWQRLKPLHYVTIILALVAIVILIWSGLNPKYPVEEAIAFPENPPPAEDHIIVKFDEGASDAAEEAIIRKEGAEKEDLIVDEDTDKVSVPEGKTAEELAEELQEEYPEYIEYTELDNQAVATMIPNDPLYSNQWQLPKVSAPAAWDIQQGRDNLVVAVLDTGGGNHNDLSAKYVAGYDFVDNDSRPEDIHGHGTFVSGIIAAITNNNRGVASAAPNVKIMPVKVLSDSGWGYYSWIASGIRWATDNGADVINMSLGGSSSSTVLQQAIDYAHARGVVVVAAAGNSATTRPSYPGACAYTIGVGATDSSDRRASFSNYGDWVDVVGPGVSVFSTRVGSNYGYGSGTSFSSPMAAALAALIQSENPSFNPDQVEHQMEQTADDLGAPGKDIYFAWGRINFRRALTEDVPPPTADGSISGKVYRAAVYTPVSGATIRVYSGSSQVASTRTLSNGSYRVEDLLPGTYKVRASASNYQTKTKNYVSVSGGRNTPYIHYGLYHQYPVVVGKVRDARTGRPIRLATVRLYTSGRRTLAKVRTNSKGNFRIKDIKTTGYHHIYANHSRYRIQRTRVPVDFYTAVRRNFYLRR